MTDETMRVIEAFEITGGVSGLFFLAGMVLMASNGHFSRTPTKPPAGTTPTPKKGAQLKIG